jgi:hypothetical protein
MSSQLPKPVGQPDDLDMFWFNHLHSKSKQPSDGRARRVMKTISWHAGGSHSADCINVSNDMNADFFAEAALRSQGVPPGRKRNYGVS